MKPTAVDGGGTNAGFNGDITSANSLTVRSRTADSANAHTDVVSISLVAGLSGGFASASITSAAVGKASIGSTSSISVDGAVLVDAGQNAASTATANADGGGGGLVSGAAFFAGASVGGVTQAELDGNVLDASSVTVQANGSNDAEGHTHSVGSASASRSAARASRRPSPRRPE